MTTNLERATGILVEYTDARRRLIQLLDTPEYVAQAFADENLLMPDLPEPDETTKTLDEGYQVHIWHGHNLDVAAVNGEVEIIDDNLVAHLVGSPEEAKELAHRIIAAANHAKGKQ